MPPRKSNAPNERALEFKAIAELLVKGDGSPRTPATIAAAVEVLLEKTYQRGLEAGMAAGRYAAIGEALVGLDNARAALDHARRPLELEAAALRLKAGIIS